MHNLLRLRLDEQYALLLDISPWLSGVVLIILLFSAMRWLWLRPRLRLVTLDIALGGVGRVQLKPTEEGAEIAHKIWTELVTRKAALPFDPENDVIVEIYDSWYALFGRVRLLIGDIPARLVRNDAGTQQLVMIAVNTLNRGLRPHLTRWQSRFRNWYAVQDNALRSASPQEVQKEFPEYDALVADLKRVNAQLVAYAVELQKVVHGR